MKTGRRKAIYQHSVPNPRQDPSVRGRASQGAPRDGRGGGSPWTARHAALPAGLSGGAAGPPRHRRSLQARRPQGTGSPGRCPGAVGWNTQERRAMSGGERSLRQSSQSLSIWKIGNFTEKGPGAGTALLAPAAAGHPLPRQHSGLGAASWEAPTCGEGSADTCSQLPGARGPPSPRSPPSGPGAGLHLLGGFLGPRTPLRPVPALPSTTRVTSADHKHPSPWKTVCPALSASNGASDSPQHEALGPTAQS